MKKVLNIGKGIELPLEFVTHTAAILAMRGRGKTHLAKVIAEEMLKQGQQIIVCDPTGAWWGLTSSASGKREGFPVVVFGGEHGVIPLTGEGGEVIADAVVKGRVSCVLDLSGFEDDAPKIRFMTRFAKRLFHINKRPVHLFLDEADEFVPQQPDANQTVMLGILKRIWQRGRIKGIGGTLISQRSAVVHKTLLSQSSTLIALQTVGPQDRAALKLWFESWGDEEQIKEFTSSISNLPKHQAWFWSPDLGIFTRGKARALETFDSSKTPEIASGVREPTRRAEIDVKKLGEDIKRLADEAKANDPARLKKELAETRAELLSAKRPMVVKETARIRTEYMPFMTPRTLKKVERLTKDLDKLSQDINGYIGRITLKLSHDGEQTLAAIRKELAKAERLMLSPPIKGTVETKAEPAKVGNRLPKADIKIGPVKGAYPDGIPARAESGNGSLRSGAQRRMMAVLALHGPSAWTKVKMLSGITSEDTMRTYVSRLASSNYLTKSGDNLEITAAGQMALGSYDQLPTGLELIQYWQGQLRAGLMRNLFDVLVLHPKKIIEPDNLMQAAGIASVDTFRTYISQLSTLQVIEKDSGGYRLSADLAAGL